jgi:N-acetylglutamate synthase-like GNAT family acetyltransferase
MEENFLLRNARESDAATIRKIIRDARINPFSLNWQHFILAVDDHDQVVGTGQVKTHFDGSRELASIAVVPACQGKGIATQIIERLLSQNPPPLYLTCRGTLGPFYRRFGFVALSQSDLTGYFARLRRIGALFERLGLARDGMLVMGKFK